MSNSRRPPSQIDTVQGPFSTNLLKDAWCRNPLLIRNAFPSTASDDDNDPPSSCWPTWEEMMEFAQDDDSSVRLVTSSSSDKNDWSSYKLKFGPLDIDTDFSSDYYWTMVMNDVDRFHPPLADWMDCHFGQQSHQIMPRWRRDDAQISIANSGGGIGPHVDNYDVFLIQMEGTREWQIQTTSKVTIQQEVDAELEHVPVRILSDWDQRITKKQIVSVLVHPGDLLYLPPRFAHNGIATTNNCMTLSVGCRAPSASELLSKLATTVLSSSTTNYHPTAVARYTDVNLFRQRDIHNMSTSSTIALQHGLTREIRDDLKQLTLDAIHNILDNDEHWDELVGTLVTEPMRPPLDYDYPIRLQSDDDATRLLNDMLNNNNNEEQFALYRAEGVSVTYSCIDTTIRLYMNGRMFQVSVPTKQHQDQVLQLFESIASGNAITSSSIYSVDSPQVVKDLIMELLNEGLLYLEPIMDEE